MSTPINWIDNYYFSKDRIVLTFEQLRIPGVRTFGKHTMQTAVSPLLPHFHENCFEITFVTKGMILFYVNNREYRVNGGDAFIAFPNEMHSTNSTPMSVGEILWLQLDISSEADFLFLDRKAAATLIRQLHAIPHHNIRTDNKEIRSVLTKAFSLVLESGNEMMTASYITIYLHLLIHFSKETQFPLTPDIGQSLNYILDNITSDLSLDFLAQYCHLSTSHYKQKFKNEMGISPRNFINQQKIEYSKSLLLDGNSITEVSMILGFSSSSYFSVIFKKYTAFTPSEYVQNHRVL